MSATEKAGVPFASVVVKRCSNRNHLIWKVTYRDGSPDRFHQGTWPNSMNPRQRQQLLDAANRFRAREETANA